MVSSRSSPLPPRDVDVSEGMAGPQDQRPPKLGVTTGGYFPRLWKAKPDAPPEPYPSKKRKKKGKAKPPGGEDGEKKGVLLEETPNLDRIETRKKVRLIAGIVTSLLVV